MSKKRKSGSQGFWRFLYFCIHAFFIVLIVALIVFEVFIFVKYGGKPINEVPSWVHWFMLSGDLL